MHTLSIQSVGEVPDVLAFDEGLHQLYVASESGTLAIFKEDKTAAKVKYKKIAQGFVAPGAHTVAVNRRHIKSFSLSKASWVIL